MRNVFKHLLKTFFMNFKFAHIADCHLGSWRLESLKQLSLKHFERAVNECVNRKVDFVIIAGDLFDTALPSVEVLKFAAKQFRLLRDNNIPVFVIPGSHDYSPTNKTMISVLEQAGLLTNLAKIETREGVQVLKPFTVKHLNVCLQGVPGRSSGLETEFFTVLKPSPCQGFKIFVFHTSITEFLQGKAFESIPASMLPEGFNYYAAGHLHLKSLKTVDGRLIAYPGPLTSTSFDEFSTLENNSFYIVTVNNGTISNIEQVVVSENPVVSIHVNADNLSPSQVRNKVLQELQVKNLENSVVLLRIEGVLSSGTVSDIEFSKIHSFVTSKGAIAFLKNISKLSTKSFEQSSFEQEFQSVEELELNIVKQHLGQFKTWFSSKELSVVKALTTALNIEKSDEESRTGYEERVSAEFENFLQKELNLDLE